jgi:peptidoglycan/LPS O-acetylase OafA/YrhL
LPDEYKQLAKQTIAGAAFTSNVELFKEAGYFDTSSDHKPLLHLWSLGIEEQFYFIWPACLVFLWKRKDKVLWAVATVAALSFAVNVLRVHGHPDSTFYLPITRFWELLLGCLLAYNALFQGGLAATLSSRWSWPVGAKTSFNNTLAIVGSILIAVAIPLIDKGRGFPGWWALLPTVGSVFLISAGPGAWMNRTVLCTPALVFIGLISYPLYLWHWPLLSFARIVATPTKTLKLTLILASIVLAWATWKFVDLKIRAQRNWIGPKADVIALSMGLAFSCLLGVVVFASNGVAGRLSAKSQALLMDVGGPVTRPQYVDGPAQLMNLSLCVQSKVGRVDAGIVGDSHAQSLFPGVAAVDQGRTWLAIGNNSCPPTIGIAVESGAQACAGKMKQAFDYLTGPDGPHIVVFSFYGYYAETTDFSADHLLNHLGPSHIRLTGERRQESKEEVLFTGLENAIQLLTRQRKQVYLVIDVPEMPFLPRDCIQRPLLTKLTTCYLDRAVVDRRQQGLRRIVKRLQEEFPALSVFDPLPLLCDNSRCNPVLGDFSYYQDSHHLSLKGSQAVAGSLVALINRTTP